MKKKKQGDIRKFELTDSETLRGCDALDFGTSDPVEFEQALKTLSNTIGPGQSVEDFILKRFEQGAQEFLQHHQDPKYDVQLHSADCVLNSINTFRPLLNDKNAGAVMLETLRLVYASLNLKSFEIIMTGVRVKSGQGKKKGKISKQTRGYLILIAVLNKKLSSKRNDKISAQRLNNKEGL
jgi:hypothetical protein